MRLLHPVGQREKFVGRGVYRYWRDDQQTPVVETWTIHELQGGARLYRVDEDGREANGLSILSEALVSPGGKIERFNVQSFNSRDPDIRDFKADYSFEPDYAQIGRKIQGEERAYLEFDLIEGAVLYIRQTLYMGHTIREVLANDGSANVFSPQLLSTEDNRLQKIIAKSRGSDTVTLGKKHVEARQFQIADDVYYWLDEHDIPVQRTYTYDGQSYRVKLTDYAHR